ncbi:SDR family oxidoreductase [Methanoculleus horonobensis]|uniref:SDR family oxidoreductase n=1 Tax=Methanoculleus horonobensis TaxID=528314 RepID=UPI000835F737|nr:SDR family oxidoreductase [Methanoculleus horonobensis]
MRMKDRVAIVTGASSGMGAAIAERFAEEGASVIVIARRKERLQSLVERITAAGGKAIAVAGDVTRDEDVENAVKTAVREFGKLDIVVNNAGLLDRFVPVAELDDDLWNAVIDVNLTGPMRMFRAAIPEMEKAGGGSFVTIASVGGLQGSRAGAAYTASKHGVIGLAKNVAYMYAKKGIRSNIIAPGAVRTEIGAGQEANEGGAAVCMAGMGTNPRVGEAEEIASVALFLVSDEASFVNGATVVADAGWTAY